MPEVPSVDFITLSKNESNAQFYEEDWLNYIEKAKNNVLPQNYAEIKNDSSNSTKLLRVLTNPNGDYLHQVDINFTFTYYAPLYFYAGANVVLETKMPDPYASDPVMHFFNADDPINKGYGETMTEGRVINLEYLVLYNLQDIIMYWLDLIGLILFKQLIFI